MYTGIMTKGEKSLRKESKRCCLFIWLGSADKKLHFFEGFERSRLCIQRGNEKKLWDCMMNAILLHRLVRERIIIDVF